MRLTKSKLLFPAVSLVLALYYTLPFLLKYDYWGVRDWDLFTTIAAVPVGTIVHYGQFPFWNPYLGGGNILFHHPEVAVLSPFLLLYLIFGPVIGLKLQVLICYFLGFWGSQRLFSWLGILPLGAVMASVAYFGSVHFALHFAEGHIPFTHFCFLPWFVYFVLSSRQRRRNIVLAGLALALMILGNGAAVPLLYTLLFSLLLFGLRSLESKELTELKNLFFSILTGLGLAAIKFVPMVVYMFQNEWEGNPEESIPMTALGSIFFGLKHSLFARNFPQQYWNWHEYGHYLSPILVTLAVIALVTRFKRYRTWSIIALFFLLLGLGDFGAFSPWALLTHLPGFSSLRCTGRAFQFVDLSVAALGAFGFDYVKGKTADSVRVRWTSFLLYAAAGIIIVTNLVLVWPIMRSAFTQEPKKVNRSPAFIHVIDENSRTYENYLANRGSLVTPWLSAYHPSRALVGADNRVFMEHVLHGNAEVKSRHYTPNTIEYEIAGHEEGAMVICMGYDPGWQAQDGRRLRQEQDLIAFAFQTGPQRVVLRYRPPYFFAGLVVSIISVLLAALFWHRRSLTAHT
jgi:hypothetical protein